MILYHGSKIQIEKPNVKGSNKFNDYGPAFYVTDDLDSAKSWACRNDSLGIVNQYHLDNRAFNNLKILNLSDKTEFSVLNWVAVLMHFRNLMPSFKMINQQTLNWLEKYYIDVDQYDIVIGFRADDSYFRFPSKFVSNELAFEDLEDVFLSGHLGIQLAFISEKAIKTLKFVKIIECDESYLGHHYRVVRNATDFFNKVISRPRDINKTYILDLMRNDNE